jgi:VWFA-related protein
MKIFRSFFVFAAGAFFVARAAAPQKPEPADPNGVIRVQTNVVLVDAVITDKKGAYVRDLKQKDFKIYEDNKEQAIKSFSFEADPASPQNNQPRYLVLFFDNSTMSFGDQGLARKAATSFIGANAGPNRLMAIVNFSGALQVTQNFTDDAERLKAIVSGLKLPVGPSPNQGGAAMGGLGRAAGNFAVRNMIMAVRDLAKNLSTIPGRKTLVLLTAGFRLPPSEMSDVTATIDMCNRSNVAIYPIDVRGLVATPAMNHPVRPTDASPFRNVAYQGRGGAPPAPAPTGGGSSGGGTKGGSPTGGAPSTGTGSKGGGGTNIAPGAGVPTAAARTLIPKFPESATTNQQIMYMLADGTGGFVIVNTNDLLGGMEKIGKEMNEFYLIGYTPPSAEDGRETCHTIRVKVDRGGTTVRARSGYCNTKMKDVLAQTTTEKSLENRAAAPQSGTVAAAMLAPYFFTSANVARVNVAIEIPPGSMKFDKEKGKMRATINVLGIAYKADGTVAARFSDAVKLDFDNQKEVDAFLENPYHYENQFDIASGQYNLKVVFSAGGENFGKLEQPLVVDSYDTKKFSVSALALSTKFEKLGQAEQKVETALLEDRTPLIASGFQVTPAGSAKFKKTDKPAMYFEIYEPRLLDAEPKDVLVGVQMRLYDAKGAMKFDTGGMRVPVPATGGNPVIPFAELLPIGTLEPGAYKVELTAMDNAKNNFVRSATFEIQ